jgi:hypothetical protein
MSIFPTSPVIGDRYSGYEWDGTVWQVVGIDFNQEYATTTDLSDHEVDTSNVHGIADTSLLATTSYVDTAESDAITTANSYTDTEISTHNSDTTNVHGIVDTSALATKTYADNAASTAAADLVDSAPSTLDTLNELASALGDDPNFATTVTNSLAGKVENSGDTITGPLAVEVSSTDAALRVTQTGTGNALLVEDSANPDATPFVVNAAGNVGIGTSSPSWPLDVQATEATQSIKIRGRASDDISVFSFNNNANTLTQAAFSCTSTYLAILVPTTERMRITSDGNVGIGTSGPAERLHVTDADSTGFAGISVQNNNSNLGIAGIDFGSDPTYRKAAIGQLRQSPNGNGPIVFYVDSSTDAENWVPSDEKMRIMPSGNVGIGTSSPSYKLDVNGNARASNIMVIVDNGTDANYARPTGVGAVYWIGSAEPVNAEDYDMWWSG